ncbi:MAG TPA: hypothetical protein PKD64_01720 [Pirellulaceae bacterium]|nr:hypothetical protein [Pirellulaceae bacterium]HMO90888.1 hypothetical protein [Pirellulaceae bacterium]HMP68636.1 hypothetical protein [Pirellulaceae bacterium]
MQRQFYATDTESPSIPSTGGCAIVVVAGDHARRLSFNLAKHVCSCLHRIPVWFLLLAISWFFATSISAQIRLPAIDPTGESLFLPYPNSTEILSPFRRHHQTTPPPAHPPMTGPAFPTPPDSPKCLDGSCLAGVHNRLHGAHGQHGHHGHHLTPLVQKFDKVHKGRHGEIIMTPSMIVAPVGSEVIVLAGICGEDGYFVINQPLEWMLSNDSAGQIIEVGGMDHPVTNQMIKPSAQKFTGDYAWGRTSLKPRLITRGTPTPVDDIEVIKGQAWVSLSSASEGTSYLTCVAPQAKAWDKRRASTVIHWVDAHWMIPAPARATAGTVFPLTVNINRSSDGSGVADWKVRYQIVGGVPAEFAPDSAQSIEVLSNSLGQAIAQIRQPAGQAAAGATQVRVDVIRPQMFGQRELVLESGITTVHWSTPALTIRTIGPQVAGVDQPFEYRVEITNPGDQVARDVIVRSSDLSGNVQYVSSEPKPSQFGNQYQWNLGEIAPGSNPRVILVQMKSNRSGVNRICFEVASSTDNLQTEACAETNILAACIGLTMQGPTEATTGQPIEYNFALTNQCNEPLKNVTMEIRFDQGLAAAGRDGAVIAGPFESILPGDTFRLPPLQFIASQPGRRCFEVIARTEDGRSTVTARKCLDVSLNQERQVRISMESYRVVRVGDDILVRIAVDNLGTGPVENATVLTRFSRSMAPKMRSATPMRWIGDDMAFDIGRLAAGARTVIEIIFQAVAVNGNAECRATLMTPDEQSDATNVTIRIEPADADLQGEGTGPGIFPPPAGSDEGPIRVLPPGPTGNGLLQVDVRAVDRTVRVGDNTQFVVTVRNTAATPDQDVGIVLLIPTGTVIQDPGTTQSNLRVVETSSDGSRIVLEPRRELRENETLSFPVTVRAVNSGISTFAISVTSNRSPIPIEGKDTITIVQ